MNKEETEKAASLVVEFSALQHQKMRQELVMLFSDLQLMRCTQLADHVMANGKALEDQALIDGIDQGDLITNRSSFLNHIRQLRILIGEYE